MFKLQRLEITGFKSFADYTEIIFTGDGITAVVGPNGCGKSNVSDAIAWVLGEQKAKSLRGEDMKDVIFQGTSKRKPSGMAEVVLHMVRSEDMFDDGDLADLDETLSEIDDHAINFEEIEPATNGHQESENGFVAEEVEVVSVAVGQAAATAPAQIPQLKIKPKRHWRPRRIELDFMPGEAVSVSRRLYLSGESEYFLNGKHCRLRDIQDLFSGTGLSGAHYAMIEQGRIGQILSAKPSDRRVLIEEAAGISKFRTRQRAAELRLDSAKTNLKRIGDIVEEIEKQANSLRRQASKTRRYKILREELRELQRKVFAEEGRFLSGLVGELQTQLDRAIEKEHALVTQVAAKEDAVRESTQNARATEESLSDLRARHAENALLRDRASREIVYQQEQQTELRSRVVGLEGEIEAGQIRLELIDKERERLEKEELVHRQEAEKEELALGDAEKAYQAKIDEFRALESELEALRSEHLTHTTAVERFAEIERHLENTTERLNERLAGLKREGERAEQSLKEFQDQSKDHQKLLTKAGEKSTALNAEKARLVEFAAGQRQQLIEAESLLNELRERASRVRHRLETLRELEEKNAFYEPGVQKLIAEESKVGVKFLGTLADKLNVTGDAEKAVESVFGSYLQTVLVANAKDAEKATAYLNENSIGRIPVLNTEKLGAANANVGKNSLLNYLGVSGAIADAITSAFPREVSAEVVPSLDSIKPETGRIYVTLKGDLLVNGRLYISGGQSKEKSSSILAFKRELRDLGIEHEQVQKEFEKAGKSSETARRALSEQEHRITEKQTLIVEAERDLMSLELQGKSIAQEIERAERHKRVVADEQSQIEKESLDISKRVAEAKASALNAETSKSTAAGQLATLAEKLNLARANAETENIVLNEKRTSAATSAERRRSAQAALRRIDDEKRATELRHAAQTQELVQTKEKIVQLDRSIIDIRQKIESASDEQTREQSELATAIENLRLARERADGESEALAELNHQAAEARNSRAEIEIKQTEANTRLESLSENCQHELNLSLAALAEEIEPEEGFDLEASRAELDNMRHRIDGFGAVNMLALEELSEAEERLLFLTSQRQDIVDSIEATEEALKEIKRRSRERFRRAFEVVNQYFGEFFVELFGGGRGEMVLQEADDILEAGIEIVAQPPGKRLQNILLLSGGEKAMTAIALVMAIFQHRPSPFCLLDEVDAPLDDANIGRFVGKIAEMAEKIQFIIITHNKRTMEAARALYGVTMQEAGVSKVVSVRFD